MTMAPLSLSPNTRPCGGLASAWRRRGVLAAFGLAVSLQSGGLLADDRLAGGHGVDAAASAVDWAAQVEFAPEPGFEGDPWQARTLALAPMPRRAIETVHVRWLDGFQQQASHLGMVIGGLGAGKSEESYTFGLTQFVRNVAAYTFGGADAVGALPMLGVAERSPHFVTSLPSPERKTANLSYNVISGRAADIGTVVSVLPGGDRLKATPASMKPCPDEICFGRELVGWSKVLRTCTRDVRIGLIDTSFDIGHPAFKKLKAVRKEFLDDVKPSPDDWHGTAILSLLAGDPESGTPGLVPDATFLLATAFKSDAAGNASTDTGRLLEALEWLDKLDVDVVNMSFAGPQDAAIARAIERMSLKGVIFVAAAGNMGPTAPPSYPAAYPHVIAVTAVNRNGESYRNANRGEYIDIAAPGVDILTALPEGRQGYQTGTSFAAPFVTAIMAARVSSGIIEGTEQHLLEQIAVRDLGTPGRDPIYGVGLALAPKRCPHNPAVVAKAPASTGAWAKRTKLIRSEAVARRN